jgi:hypothetical protein
MFVSTIARDALEERLDPAFYSPIALEADAWVRGRPEGDVVPLSALVGSVASAFYEGIAERYTDSGIPLLRVADVRNGSVTLQRAVHLPEKVAKNTNGLRTVRHPTVVITKGGSVGRVALTTQPGEYALSRDVIGLVPKRDDFAGLVLLFLGSPPGRAQVLRGASRQVQAHLTIDRLGETRVPRLDDAARAELTLAADAVREARCRLEDARAAVDDFAADLDPFARMSPRALSFNLPHGDALRVRMDPGFYRPDFRATREAVREIGWVPLHEAPWVDFVEDAWDRTAHPRAETVRYIPLSAVELFSSRITGTLRLRAWQVPSRARWNVRENDVLYPYLLTSLDRVALVGAAEDGAVASSGFYPIRTPDSEHALALAAYLSSRGTQEQILRAGTGGVMQSVSRTLLGNILVPPLAALKGLAALMREVQAAAINLDERWHAGLALSNQLCGWHGTADVSMLDDSAGGEAEQEDAVVALGATAAYRNA